MAVFDLPKLSGSREKFSFPGSDGTEIIIWAHHPTPEELAAAYRDAGVAMDNEGTVTFGSENHFEAAVKSSAALVELAWLCIEATENLDGWPSVARSTSPDGLDRLTRDARAIIPRVVAKAVGDRLVDASKLSTDEGNA